MASQLASQPARQRDKVFFPFKGNLCQRVWLPVCVYDLTRFLCFSFSESNSQEYVMAVSKGPFLSPSLLLSLPSLEVSAQSFAQSKLFTRFSKAPSNKQQGTTNNEQDV